MSGPLDSPDGNWWDNPVNRRETIWLGIAGAWSVGIFGWMTGFTRFGDQNPVGETYEVTPEGYNAAVETYIDNTPETEEGYLKPEGESVYIQGVQWFWRGLPVVLEAGKEYDVHLGSLDVQHGFSIRPEDSLSQQINLQVLPDTEWIVPMTFEEPGTYHVICNEYCGQGHSGMHGKLIVRE